MVDKKYHHGGDLKGVLDVFLLQRECLGKNPNPVQAPHHFPFTEPSAEMDVLAV